jgi:isoleucyl-tRNA synthetase
VWFDSGSTFSHVLRGSHQGSHAGNLGRHDSGPEADLYLEGHDQHRGWFHSSLLLGCALEGRAPYKGLLTHGFTVDGQGRKMSKSLGNFVEMRKVTSTLGAEIIRLWAAATDYSGDLSIDDTILARVVDSYRRIRNTLRFLLANTSATSMPQHMPCRWRRCWRSTAGPLSRVAANCRPRCCSTTSATSSTRWWPSCRSSAAEDLGAFYLDVLKDRLYTTAAGSLARRSAQTALWHITHSMLRWMAPFLSFTAEEAWKVLLGGQARQRSSPRPSGRCPSPPDTELLAKWARVRELRETVNKEIEALRTPAAWARRCRPT